MKKLLKLLFLFFSFIVYGQSSFSVQPSKTTVEVGESFQLEYRISYNSVMNTFSGDEVNFPNFKGFIELGTAKSSSISIINNKTKAEIVYIKTLQAMKEGVFKINPAKIKGKKIVSNSVTIKVVARSKKQTIPQQTTNNFDKKQNNLPDSFVKWIPQKTNPYLYEGIHLKLRFYSKDIDLIRSIKEIKPPKFENLISHVIKSETNSIDLEVINSQEYAFVDLQQWIVFPQTTEKIVIGSARVGISSFSGLFGNELSFINSEPITINPKPLPENAPKDFSGAVGQFKLLSMLDKNKIKTSESASLEIELIGNGNLDLIKMPDFSLSDSIETYNPKERQNIEITENGLKGKVVSEYILVPEYEGNFSIPTISFTYFDPIEEMYKTIQSERIQLSVTKNLKAKSLPKQQAIESNKENESTEITQNNYFSIILALILGLIAIIIFILFKKQNKKIEIPQKLEIQPEKEVVAKVIFDEKSALEKLKQLVDENNSKLFYEEQERFINNWLLNKTQLEKAKLTIENIKTYFLSAGFDKETVDELEKLIIKSKEAKYASIFQNNAVNLNDDYQSLVKMITKF